MTQDVEKEGARTVEGKPIVVKRDTMLSNVIIMLLCKRPNIQSKLSNLYNVCLMKTRSDMHGIIEAHDGEEFTKVRRATTSVKFQLVWVPRKHGRREVFAG